ncbi:hypothetical protein AAHE18_18G067900 [Arachis hypogaea]
MNMGNTTIPLSLILIAARALTFPYHSNYKIRTKQNYENGTHLFQHIKKHPHHMVSYEIVHPTA